MKNLNLLKSQGFIFGLTLLLLNDFVLKELYSNWFTGKLSDLAGLFIFPLFWLALFPKHKLKIFWSTIIFFLFWKSGYSAGSIELWNSFGLLNVGRVVDYSDLLALFILPLTYHYHTLELKNNNHKRVNISPLIPMFIALFAFGATSYQKNYDYNKVYTFPFSKQELVDRFNVLSNDSLVQNYPLSLRTSMINHYITENADSLAYYVSVFTTKHDTIYTDITRNKIDTIYKYKVPTIDSMYPNRQRVFYYNFPVYKYMRESKTGYCHTLPAKLIIGGEGNSSSLTLVTIFTHNCMGMFEKDAAKNEEQNLLKAFETEVINKIKK